MLGKWSDQIAGRFKKTGRKLVGQGKDLVERVVSEGTETLSREAEREGLTPSRLTKKIRRLTAHVRDAVSDAVQD